MADSFFKDENYKIPTTSNYMKLSEGEHTFRVLASAIVGWEYFSKENKPVRSREPFDESPSDIKQGGRINHFWAFPVWNYEAKRVQILELTQKSLQEPIQSLIKNPKWGSPFEYDITITRKGTGLQDTSYTVVPNPKSEVPPEAVKSLRANPIDLDKLFSGDDPFSA